MGDIVIGRDLTEVVSHILSMQQQNRDTSPLFAEIKRRGGNRKLLSVMRLLYAHAVGYETKLSLPRDANTRSVLTQIFYSADADRARQFLPVLRAGGRPAGHGRISHLE